MYRQFDELMEKVDNRFTLVVLAAKRAREINSYFNGLKRGELTQIRGPRIELVNKKPLTIAFDEIVEGKVSYTRETDGIK